MLNYIFSHQKPSFRLALEKVGLFRPYLTTGGDADICWRIQQANLGRLEFAPLAIAQHRHRTTLEELASTAWLK